MQAEQLNSFWHCAQTNNPVLSYEQFREIPVDSRQAMLAAGLLKEGQPSRSVECDGCEDGHVEEVRQVEYPDGKRRFFISCPQCSCVEVKPQRLRQWVPDYGKVAELVSDELDCFGGLTEVVPNRIWKLGQSPLGNHPVPVWMARYIVNDLVPQLARIGDGVLFVMGVNPRFDIGVAQERIVNISEIISVIGRKVAIRESKAKAILQSLTNSDSSLSPYIFRRKGSMWQIRFAGQSDFNLPNRKGAEYLRQLLLSPGNPLDVSDIIAQSSAQFCNELMTTHEAIENGLTIKDNALLASAGEISDWETIKQYRKELLELRADKEKAKSENSTVELAQIEQDITYIVQQIKKSVNVHGKLTTASDKQRNLRDMLSKNIKRFIDEIAKTDSECAEHFEQALNYGNQPVYHPKSPIEWETEFILS